MVHGRELSFFYDGETFSYAAYKDGQVGRLFRLPDGSAEAERAFTRSSLRCPFPECDSPTLTTVNRASQGLRDGFRHMRRGNRHEPESWYHLIGKAAVRHWAAEHPAVASVDEEVRLGNRVADVLLTCRAGGRLAVEVQYSALTVEQYRERTTSYRAMGISVVWLWGHVGHHGLSKHSAAVLRDVHRAVLADGMPLLWLNPATEQLAWAVGDDDLLPTGDAGGSGFRILDLDRQIAVSQYGMFPPGWDVAVMATDAAEQDERRRQAVRLNAQQEARLRKAARDTVQELPREEKVPVTWDYWQRRMPMREGQVCDVCKYPVLPSQERSRRRHEVCDY